MEPLSDDLDQAFERLLATGGSDVQTITIGGNRRYIPEWGTYGYEPGPASNKTPIGNIGSPNLPDGELRRLMTAANETHDVALEKFKEGKYAIAISTWWMSLYYERMIGSPFRLANDYGNIGTAYLLAEYLPEARAALDESLRLYTAANSAAGAAKTYYWLSHWELRKKNWLRAHECARRSLLLFEKHEHQFAATARELLDWIGTKLTPEQPR